MRRRTRTHCHIWTVGPRGSDAIITPSNDDDDDIMWAGVGLRNPTAKQDVRPCEGLRVDRIHEKLKAGPWGSALPLPLEMGLASAILGGWSCESGCALVPEYWNTHQAESETKPSTSLEFERYSPLINIGRKPSQGHNYHKSRSADGRMAAQLT